MAAFGRIFARTLNLFRPTALALDGEISCAFYHAALLFTENHRKRFRDLYHSPTNSRRLNLNTAVCRFAETASGAFYLSAQNGKSLSLSLSPSLWPLDFNKNRVGSEKDVRLEGSLCFHASNVSAFRSLSGLPSRIIIGNRKQDARECAHERRNNISYGRKAAFLHGAAFRRENLTERRYLSRAFMAIHRKASR